MANFPTNVFTASVGLGEEDVAVELVPAGTNGILTGAHIAISGLLGAGAEITFALGAADDPSSVAWSTTIHAPPIAIPIPYLLLISGPYSANLPFEDGVSFYATLKPTIGRQTDLMISINVAADLNP